MTSTSTGPVISQAGELRSVRVESLRAVTALTVVVAHAMVWSYQHGSQVGLGFVTRAAELMTQTGPFIFFVLSGCLLYGPFARRSLDGGGGSIDLRRYAANRALRILPVYYAVLLVLLVFREHQGTPAEWALYASFSTNFLLFPSAQLNRVMWSMAIEFQFYVALPALAFLLARVSRGSLRRAALALALLAVASLAFFVYAWHVDGTPDPTSRFSLPATFFFVAAGMLLALVRLSWEEQPPGWLRGPPASADVWLAAAAGISALMVVGRFSLPSMSAMVSALLVSVLLVGACVLPLRRGPLARVLEWRPLAFVGVAAYSLYLWHDPILGALTLGPWAPSTLAGLLAVGLPLCILVAFASYALIEAPFLRLRRRWARWAPDHANVTAGTRRAPRAIARTAVMLPVLAAGVVLMAQGPATPAPGDRGKADGSAVTGRVLEPERIPGGAGTPR